MDPGRPTPPHGPELRPYGDAPAAEPQWDRSARIWGWVSIVGLFLCWPVGLVAGVVAVARAGKDRRAWWLGLTGLCFSAVWGTYTVLMLIAEIRAEL